MAWFDEVLSIDKSQLRFAHISDCHLFAEVNECYFGVNCCDSLRLVLTDLAEQTLDFVIFGGDLTQDHSLASYQLFAQLVNEAQLPCPVLWLPGNHDELDCYQQAFSMLPSHVISRAKWVQSPNLTVALVNSKGPTPAGWVEPAHLTELVCKIKTAAEKNVVFCHHHPKAIAGYLDKHILENGEWFLTQLAQTEQVTTVFHGHVHNDYLQQHGELSIYATPATSIQFVKNSATWQQEDLGAGYRIIHSNQLGEISSEVVWLARK
ncbi:metallophosphoesterase family protein [Pseudoalteromonas tunicata]|uniref:Cyclic 3',5'-adenosine monophosphate phosphodiesterase n=1 Tax=Pseudoalteromonas tunicata D2 TaxID=87626 RepID=A4C954_9GAMM|nr:metallophosphoesterase [Pseudoalteromonas tunicata]ATC93621.1 Icc protein [Pseudoalteromonas tunicata]AXT29456.1 3',5'-cyclic-nucleotide phosphodiesterase [Pseudoalteromonas tunicata]EAR29119.1 cyclic 3',5'-adenosine monophosphate phosphodiesterase [Pseudoalteromonas tunicata D2]